MSTARREIFDDPAQVARAVADAMAGRLAGPGLHHVVLTGGGMGTAVLSALAGVSATVDWERVHLWWGDERFLARGHPDRNETSARAALIDRIPIPQHHVHPIPPDVGQGADAAASAYADELAAASTDGYVPFFDVLLLGLGAEGHVASLFPRSNALHASASVVGVHGCPKPPPTRVSLTLPAIRAAADVWVVAAGADKAAAAAAAMDDATPMEDVPAAAARGRLETIFWLDRDAGQPPERDCAARA